MFVLSVADTSAPFARLADFFSRLLAPGEFTSSLLERSFNQTAGWVEAVLSLLLLAAGYGFALWYAGRLAGRPPRRPFGRHLLLRAAWPLAVLALAVPALYGWEWAGLRPLWLRLLILAAHWMLVIRMLLAVVHAALPSNRLTDWLERSLSALLWLVFLARLSGLDDLAADWMRSLTFTVGSSKLNLWTLAGGLLWVGVILVLAMWLAKFIQTRLMANQHIDLSLRIMLSNIVRVVLVVLSVLIALPLVGIDLTVLSVFGGALGVGIGFGLQKIASNYISGFMILGDRSIRPGDRLTVNNFTGYVTKITSRFVVLRNASGSEALIPNETFITNTVINESYSGTALWRSLDVQIAYQSDVVVAMRIMAEAAAKQERVGQDPPPRAYLIGFGDNGINLSVGFWVRDPENGFLGLFSAILLDIWQRFNEENIVFPYPQREVRLLGEAAKPSETALQRAAYHAREDTRSDETGED